MDPPSCRWPRFRRLPRHVIANHLVSIRLFMHGGHTNHLADFSWNQNDPWLVCSAAEDNLLQVWKCSSSITLISDGDVPVEELR